MKNAAATPCPCVFLNAVGLLNELSSMTPAADMDNPRLQYHRPKSPTLTSVLVKTVGCRMFEWALAAQ